MSEMRLLKSEMGFCSKCSRWSAMVYRIDKETKLIKCPCGYQEEIKKGDPDYSPFICF